MDYNPYWPGHRITPQSSCTPRLAQNAHNDQACEENAEYVQRSPGSYICIVISIKLGAGGITRPDANLTIDHFIEEIAASAAWWLIRRLHISGSPARRNLTCTVAFLKDHYAVANGIAERHELALRPVADILANVETFSVTL